MLAQWTGGLSSITAPRDGAKSVASGGMVEKRKCSIVNVALTRILRIPARPAMKTRPTTRESFFVTPSIPSVWILRRVEA